MQYPEKMDTEWKNLIENTFGKYLIWSSIGGRGAFKFAEEQMDIDIFVVVEDTIIEKKKEFNELWKKFIVGYKDIHKKYGFTPDPEFPGDFATLSQIYDVISGRGFVEKNGQIFIKSMESIEDENDENDYLIFLSLLIGGRFLSGNESFFSEIKLKCFELAIKYLFIENIYLTKEEVLKKFRSKKEKTKFGFDTRYGKKFDRMAYPFIKKVIKNLLHLGYIRSDELTPEKFVATESLQNFGKTILSRKFLAKHLMPFKDEYYKKKRKEIFSGIKALSHWDKISLKSENI